MTQVPREFEISTERADGAAVVRIAGELDIASQDRLTEELVKVTNGSAVVVDLSDCEFIDSSGLRAILLGSRDAGGRLSIASPRPQVIRLLELTGSSKVVPVHESVEAALKSLD